MNFQDCYKVLIETIGDFSNWSNSKIIDDCVDSNDESVTLYTWTPITTDDDHYWVGDGTVTSSMCFDLPMGSLSGQIASRLVTYFLENATKQTV
jgi:hypothetical protein